MHRCVISTMFGSCFWFFKKTFLFKQPLVPPYRPGPSPPVPPPCCPPPPPRPSTHVPPPAGPPLPCEPPPPTRAGVSYIWGSYILGMDDETGRMTIWAESGVASFLIPKTVQNGIRGCFISHPQNASYIRWCYLGCFLEVDSRLLICS
jgi:hypothetical protein